MNKILTYLVGASLILLSAPLLAGPTPASYHVDTLIAHGWGGGGSGWGGGGWGSHGYGGWGGYGHGYGYGRGYYYPSDDYYYQSYQPTYVQSVQPILPSFTMSVSNPTVSVGQSVTFNVSPAGRGPMTIYFSIGGDNNWKAASSTFTINPRNAGTVVVTVVVKDAYGLYSQPQTVQLNVIGGNGP